MKNKRENLLNPIDENWKEFYTQYLKPSIKTENHDLAGFTKKQSDDFLEENVHIGNNVFELE